MRAAIGRQILDLLHVCVSASPAIIAEIERRAAAAAGAKRGGLTRMKNRMKRQTGQLEAEIAALEQAAQ
jgi:hypothetical protein